MASAEEPVVLWCLRGHGRDVRCLRQKTRSGLELRVLWGEELFLTETFQEPDRLATRAEEFRATLETRGWKRLPQDEAPPPPGPGWMPDPEPADGPAEVTILDRRREPAAAPRPARRARRS